MAKDSTVIFATVGLMAAMVLGLAATGSRRERAAAPPPTLSSEKIQTISTGQRVDIAAYLPDQGRTVVEFTAKW